MVAENDRAALEKELQDMQNKYGPGSRGDDGGATRLYGNMVGITVDVNAAHGRPSMAERMIAQLEQNKVSNAAGQGARSSQDEILVRKDGLDLSLHHLRSDAARMRNSLMELQLAIGKPAREAAAQKVRMQAIPQGAKAQFEDQQRVLVEQRRLLDQLRRERQDARDMQDREMREATANADEAHPDVPNASTLREARRLLREETADRLAEGAQAAGTRLPLQPNGLIAPPQDGYLLVELYRIEGLRNQQYSMLRDFSVQVLGRGKALVAQACVPAPFEFEGMTPKRVQLTVPPEHAAEHLQVHLQLHAYDGSGSCMVNFLSLGEDRKPPHPVALEVNGQWKEEAQRVTLHVALSGIAPHGAAGTLAGLRVLEQPTHAHRTAWEPDLPPSQAHVRQKAQAWLRAGAPEPTNVKEQLDGLGRAYQPPAPEPPPKEVRPSLKEAERYESDDDAPAFGGGGFFAGFGLRGADPRALPQRSGNSPRSPGSGMPQPSGASPRSPGATLPQFSAAPLGNPGAAFPQRAGTPPRGLTSALPPRSGAPGAGMPQRPGTSPTSPGAGMSQRAGTPPRSPGVGMPQRPGTPPRSPGAGAMQQFGYQPRSPGTTFGDRVAEGAAAGGSSPQGEGAAPFVAFAGFSDRGATTPSFSAGQRRQECSEAGFGEPDFGARGGGSSSSTALARSVTPPRTRLPQRFGPGDDAVPPFAAFAGESLGPRPQQQRVPVQPGQAKVPPQPGSARTPGAGTLGSPRGGPSSPRSQAAAGLLLRPPSNSRTIPDQFVELRSRVEAGRLGQQDAQLVLDFAARLAQPGALAAETLKTDEELGEYAGLLLTALEAYKGSVNVCLWCLEGLISVAAAASEPYRQQLAVPLFESFQAVAIRFKAEGDPKVHHRILSGLVAVTNPDCSTTDNQLVDYILQQLDRHKSRMPPLAAEHALALLCVIGRTHRVNEQIGHAVLVLRAFKSDAHLAMRALVALAELFDFVETDRLAKNQTREQALSARHIPKDPEDVRVVLTCMELYLNHRKVAGAGARALSRLADAGGLRLQLVAREGQRVLMQVQRRHIGSRSVNLHAVEIMQMVAEREMDLITDGSVLLVSQAMRAYWRDSAVAVAALGALVPLAEQGKQFDRIAEIFPAPQLLLLDEAHHGSPQIVGPLCRLIVALTASSIDACEDFGKAGAMSVCVRTLEAMGHDSSCVRPAAAAMRRLILGSPDAHLHVARLGGVRSLFDALVTHHSDKELARELLQALAVVAQTSDITRRQLCDAAELQEAKVTVEVVMRIGFEGATSDPDLLAWACCAVGCLTFSEKEQGKTGQVKMRRTVDKGRLEEVVVDLSRRLDDFRFGVGHFDKLMNGAPMCDLSLDRLISKEGAEVGFLRPKGRLQKTKKKLNTSDTLNVTADMEAHEDAAENYDVFGHIRGLGIGKAPIDEVDDDQDLDGGGQGGGFLSLLGF